jgi:phthalate 4,5-cis-dihydrodiol dehydrogenase
MRAPNQNQAVRLALIGCGEHSQENLVPSLAQLRHASVIMVCDCDGSAASEAARRLGNRNVETNWEHILARDDVDAIVVAATPQVHSEVARKGLRRGLHVFVEKPPTVTRNELVELAAEADKRQRVTCVGHNLRHAAAAIEMRSLLGNSDAANADDESFGHPVAMEMRYFASKPRGDRWDLNSPLRSFLLSHANHAIDFMIYQMGPIAKVNAALATAKSDGIALSVQFIFRSGAVGNLLATSFAPHFAISGTIVSDRNRVVHLNSLNEVVAYGMAEDPKRWGRCWTSKTLLTGYEAAGYLTELQRFIEAIRLQQPGSCHPSFADELAIYDAMDEIEKRIEKGAKAHDSLLPLAIAR